MTSILLSVVSTNHRNHVLRLPLIVSFSSYLHLLKLQFCVRCSVFFFRLDLFVRYFSEGGTSSPTLLHRSLTLHTCPHRRSTCARLWSLVFLKMPPTQPPPVKFCYPSFAISSSVRLSVFVMQVSVCVFYSVFSLHTMAFLSWGRIIT